jgi:hypothetical protein
LAAGQSGAPLARLRSLQRTQVEALQSREEAFKARSISNASKFH